MYETCMLVSFLVNDSSCVMNKELLCWERDNIMVQPVTFSFHRHQEEAFLLRFISPVHLFESWDLKKLSPSSKLFTDCVAPLPIDSFKVHFRGDQLSLLYTCPILSTWYNPEKSSFDLYRWTDFVHLNYDSFSKNGKNGNFSGFHGVALPSTVSRSNWNLEMLVFVEGGKPEYSEKNPRNRDENQQQTQPTYDAETGNRTRATLVGGECSHYCAIPVPMQYTLWERAKFQMDKISPSVWVEKWLFRVVSGRQCWPTQYFSLR